MPSLVELRVQMHRRVHPVGVPVEVPRGLEERLLGDVWRVDELIAGLFVATPRVVLHDPTNGAALGVEDRQPGADLVGEGEEVELGAETSMVAALGLLQEAQVRSELLLRRPCGPVDALQLGVLLAAPPVGRRRPHQLEGRDQPGRRQVGSSTEVLPLALPALGIDVLVDGQLRHRQPPSRHRRLRRP